MSFRKPTLHLNGTSREALQSKLELAHARGREFQRAMEDAAPNGRDYYPQGDDATQDAVKRWRGAQEKIEQILNDLQEVYLHTHD